MTVELDIEDTAALRAYLRAEGRLNADEEPNCCRLTGGVSNRTVLVERQPGPSWVLKQALEKLRVPVDWFSDPERIHVEARALRRLGEIAPAGTVPEFLFEDHRQHLIAMTAVPQPHRNWKELLLEGELVAAHVEQFARLLAMIHRRSSGLDNEISSEFADRSFFETLRLQPYYEYTSSRLPEAASFLRELIDSTRAHRVCWVHGDYSPKNVLVHNDRLVLLDHEVMHVGDPAFDLGFSLTHFLSKANHFVGMRQRFADAAMDYWRCYRVAVEGPSWVPELEARAVRSTIGCMLARVAGKSQLEYLTEDQKRRQRDVLLQLIDNTPRSVNQLVQQFVRRIR